MSLRSWQNSGCKSTERVGHPPSLSHTYVPVGQFWQACHHPYPPPPPPFPHVYPGGGSRTDQLAVTKPFRVCVRAGRISTSGGMERGGERRGGRVRGVEVAAVVGSVLEQGEIGLRTSTNRSAGNGWLHHLNCVRERWSSAVTRRFQTLDWGMLSSQRGKGWEALVLSQAYRGQIKMISSWKDSKLKPKHVSSSFIHTLY